ncbi:MULTISPECIES: acyl carrier protein [Streptomyces]|jgi:acyl carrier protein|uniref:acyl carrier protein n=1 Tax=Streptomyces TaxID=1883 RepID=UPI001907267F|nr:MULTISPECIES: acyl carrier protein [unclassified Streptomyces]MCU4746384.1 acyl carrier protein [Streptomyces sp. G-5]QQN76669.1 acyl carrier protein [Streptomyces sp. XC 2026]
MTEEEIHRLVRHHLVSLDPLTADVPIRDDSTFGDLGIDSMSLVDLLFAFEREHGIEIPDEDLEGITTVGDLVRQVSRTTA